MSTRLFIILFIALVLIGAFPIFFIQPFGIASAGVTAGFMMSMGSLYHVTVAIAIGLLSVWMGAEAILLLPLGVLLMLAIGGLMQIEGQAAHPVIQYFIAGAILLFSLSMSLMRNKVWLVYVLPLSVWAYFSGSSFMQLIPPITTPFFLMIGIIVSNALILAMGVALGITLADNTRLTMDKLKNSSAFATFLSLF